MNERTDFESVEQTSARLNALCTRAGLNGTGTTSLLADLRELRTLFETLQVRNGLLREVLDETNDFVFAKHDDGRYAMINPKGAELFGMPLAEILDTDDRAIFEPAVAEKIMAGDREVMRDGKPKTREISAELRGTPVTLKVTTLAWYNPDRTVRGVIGAGRDVTEAEAWRARARSQAVALVVKEELLRRSLATELHSGLCQDIALTRMKLSSLRGSVGSEHHLPLVGIEDMLELADRSLRSITYRLSPPSLHDLGLVAALQWLAEDLHRTHGLTVTVRDQGFPAIHDEAVRVLLYRSVRELLSNVIAHSGENAVTVILSGEDELLRISVEDGGKGFDIEAEELEGFGLFGIREQLAHVGGNVELRSAPGQGTKVTLTAPSGPAVTAGTTGH